MAIVDVGDTYRNTFRMLVDGTLADPATVTASVTLPDGTTSSPTPTQVGPGVWEVLYTTSQAGRHTLAVTGSGGDLGTIVVKHDDVINAEATGGLLVSVGEALAHMRATGTITTDGDLEHARWLCLVATDAVQGDLGRTFVRQAVVDTLDGGKTVLILLSYPVISVTSITENGTALSVGDYTTNLRLGHVQRGSSLAPQRWSNGYQNIVATYVIGERIVPPIARKVALNGIERMWQSSQQALHPGIEPFVGNFVTVAAGTLTPLELTAYNKLRAPGIG
ncbi:MAG: hypothetical protein A2135_10070 [Actinobacteria bacterium RBG_16_67_15]|nr:MAG: hypothetical protein A2135_10070 [Actinobacteria bacterium RBG_16_67_15]